MTQAEPRLAVEVTAAIIAAVNAAAATASTQLQQALGDTGNAVVQGGVVDNDTSHDFRLYKAAAPNHGDWAVSPPTNVPRVPTPQQVFEVWKASGDAPDAVLDIVNEADLSEPQQELLAAWIRNSYEAPESPTFGLQSTGAGVESVVIYTNNSVAIALYLKNPKVGDAQAGAMMATHQAMENLVNESTRDDDPTLEKVYDKILDSVDGGSDYHCELSSGDTQRFTFGGLTIEFSAAEETIFTIRR